MLFGMKHIVLLKPAFNGSGVYEHERAYDEHMVLEMNDGRIMMIVSTMYGLGVSYSYDRGKIELQAKTIAELIRRGWEDKILVSYDHSVFIDWGDTTCEKLSKAHLDRNFTNRN